MNHAVSRDIYLLYKGDSYSTISVANLTDMYLPAATIRPRRRMSTRLHISTDTLDLIPTTNYMATVKPGYSNFGSDKICTPCGIFCWFSRPIRDELFQGNIIPADCTDLPTLKLFKKQRFVQSCNQFSSHDVWKACQTDLTL